jgi:two-component system, chemotaxis family, sensor kinase CheA
MDKKQQEFLKRLRETFRVEADEHLRAMSAGVLKLEKELAGDEQAATVEVVFREAHSLKGAARAVNLLEIERVCQSLESVFSAAKRGEISLSLPFYDQLHDALALIGDLLSAIGAEPGTAEKSRVAKVMRELGEALRELPPAPAPARSEKTAAADPPVSEPAVRAAKAELPPAERGIRQVPASAEVTIPQQPEKDFLPLPETVRISTAKLNSILLEAEEMLSAKLALGQRVAELREASALLASWERDQARIRPELRTFLRELEKKGNGNGTRSQPDGRAGAATGIAKVAAFAESTEQEMKTLQSRLTVLAKSAEQDRRTLSVIVDRLLEDTRKALMLPFATFLESIPKLVRDLARDSGKDVELVIQGGEIEVDRRILEEMKDPLVHLIRNSVDHGIEKPLERERRAKPPQGIITIAISQKDGAKIEMLVSDDGAGINLPEVRASGLKAGAISQNEAARMDDAATVSLIFQSGITTSPIVTDLSGRGLGLAIVREKVDKLGGTLAVDTQSDVGTTFRMVLPLTLAAFRGVLVRAQEQVLIVPSVQVAHTLRLKPNQIKSVENRETIEHESKVVSLARLGDVLGLPRTNAPGVVGSSVYIIVLTYTEQRMAFVVDEILDEQEVLVKSLGQNLPRVRNITGAAVLGTGKVVPVLNVSDLMQSARNVTTLPALPAGIEPTPPARRRRLLVAEDSITTRTLLKNILESAGYTVKTAVDGVDALTTLRAEEFDLVVSDVDMPRMNGFGLTSAIRTDKRLAEVPVVLVTALESREDRERGIDVGANAYIVKSSFEQSNLLEVVERLI